ncbi:MAG: NAD(P)H-dependent glycerol-3-phosphate dehydrogenase [bacterium]|nr:NAD(P)-dependent glycerol-3-phosphate dehydrogenase [Planctomycetota bacterium]HIL52337.1 NAD(P)-dependent glycerol-3-phosphate dehydrogenase [Planctomycetota bacterium]
MQTAVKKALVLGDGSWGTTLAILLCRNGIETTLWSAFPEQTEQLRANRENRPFLPGIVLPDEMLFSADPYSAAEGTDLVVSVVPTQYLRSAAARFEDALPGNMPIVTATKGLEIETFSTPSQILVNVLGERSVAVLTGPSHAEEVAHGLPASVVVASADDALAQRTQAAFSGNSFRVYTCGDPVGAEYASALKNVIAIAAGISDGLELGDNAKAALLTRGMLEMARFGAARGSQATTFFGLAGFGDLVTTCCSAHSRNRSVGEAIGRGETLEQILERMNMVAEGIWTTKALFGPEADLGGASLPIASEVHAILFEGKDPRSAVLDLMGRELAAEMDGITLEELA